MCFPRHGVVTCVDVVYIIIAIYAMKVAAMNALLALTT